MALQRYKMPKFVHQLALVAGLKVADSNGFFTPANAAEEAAFISLGGQPEFGVVWDYTTAGAIQGFINPKTGASIPFPAAGINLAAPGAIGATTPGTGSFTSLRSTSLQSAITDGTGTPGNITQNVGRGRVALAAGVNNIVVTNSQVAANSTVLCQLRSTDGAATAISTVVTAAGSFAITMNGATTGTACQIDYLVVQN